MTHDLACYSGPLSSYANNAEHSRLLNTSHGSCVCDLSVRRYQNCEKISPDDVDGEHNLI